MSIERIFRHCRLSDRDGDWDVAIGQGKILDVATRIDADAPTIDLGSALLIPGFTETHIHLDKSCLAGKIDGDGTLAGAISAIAQAKPHFSVEDVLQRGRKTLEKAIFKGTNLMRCHVEVDPRIGLRGFDAMQILKRDYAFAIDLQLCVFPQEGLLNDPGCEELLIQALQKGADLIGGCPYTDSDPKGHIERVFAIAKRFDVDIDLHLDFDLDPSWMSLSDVIQQTERHRYGGRVTVGHVTKLSMLDDHDLSGLATRLAGAGIAVTVLPATDLFLMGRELGADRPRGVSPAHKLSGDGVCCSIATNNVLNAFTPYGDCSLPRMANLFANIQQIGSDHGLAACLNAITHDAERLLGRQQRRIEVGADATFITLDCADPAMIVREMPDVLGSFFKGIPVFERDKARFKR